MGKKIEKKILMLSLGKGRENVGSHTVDEILEKDLSSYEEITYHFQGGEMKTNYVAEPLNKLFNPDYIYFVGTNSSGWVSLYLYFNKDKKTYNDIEVLRDIELGKYGDNYEEAEKKMDDILSFLSPKFGAEKVHVILLPLGKSEDELHTIYERLSVELNKDLKEGYEYKVAFDITHSFRSLPFYNYAVLSYFKEVTKYNVSIEKIYYGMAELAKENGQHVPVLALDEVNSIMNLTSAVSEFKQTGSVKSLLNYLDKVENKNDDLKELYIALKKFDWAIGSNDGSAVVSCIGEINKIVNKAVNETNKYTDIIRVLKNALDIEVCKGVGSLLDISKTTDPMKYANNQLILATWYLNQHRYSQATCVGGESLKSYCAILWLEAKRTPFKIDNIKDENIRRDSVELIFLKIKPNDDDLNKKCIELGTIFKNSNSDIDFRSIRNKCAHNLENNDGVTLNGKEIEVINNFMKKLGEFSIVLQDDNKHSQIVQYMVSKKRKRKKTNVDKITFFICKNLTKENKEYLLTRSNGVKSEAYILDKNIFKGIDKSKFVLDELKNLCFYIVHYIDNFRSSCLQIENKFEIIISNDIDQRLIQNLVYILQSHDSYKDSPINIYNANRLESASIYKTVLKGDLSEYNDYKYDDFNVEYPDELNEDTPVNDEVKNGTPSLKDIPSDKMVINNTPSKQENNNNIMHLNLDSLKESVYKALEIGDSKGARDLIQKNYSVAFGTNLIIQSVSNGIKPLKTKSIMPVMQSLIKPCEITEHGTINCKIMIKQWQNLDEIPNGLELQKVNGGTRAIKGKNGVDDLIKYVKKAILYNAIVQSKDCDSFKKYIDALFEE